MQKFGFFSLNTHIIFVDFLWTPYRADKYVLIYFINTLLIIASINKKFNFFLNTM